MRHQLRSGLCGSIAALALCACSMQPEHRLWPTLGGNPARGAATITTSACGACHVIPGVQNADGMVGPPLDHFARRTMVAGVLPNSPANLIQWIRFPQAVVPGNAMPDTRLTDAQARDVAAYLYTLR